MSVSEQVHYLRSLAADQTPKALYEVFDALNEAANTIEFLSAKLTDMERSSEDCGRFKEVFEEIDRLRKQKKI